MSDYIYEDDDDFYDPDEDSGIEMTTNTQIKILEEMTRHGTGYGFVMMVRNEGGNSDNVSYHPRFNQPCQGGELRKYKSTHPDETTQPHNEKPHDLHHPFPDGTPRALGFWNVKQSAKLPGQKEMFRALVSDESPWVAGFGGSKNIIEIMDGDRLVGFILKRLDIDPTVLVNGLNFINKKLQGADKYLQMTEAGATPNEALGIFALNGCDTDLTRLASTYDYYQPTKFSARRFFDQKPQSLTGGTLEQRADYNRTFVQDVFGSSDGLQWYPEMKKILGKESRFSLTELVAASKEFFQKGLDKELSVSSEYVYRSANGKVMPYPDFALKINPSLVKQLEKAV